MLELHRMLSHLPERIEKYVSNAVGAYNLTKFLFLTSDKSIIKTVAHCTSSSRKKAIVILFQSSMSQARSATLFWNLCKKNPRSLRSFAQISVEIENLEAVKELENGLSGKIVYLNSFALHFSGLLSESLWKKLNGRVSIVQPKTGIDYVRSTGFYELIESTFKVSINTIVSDSPAAYVLIHRALEAGECVLMRGDSLPVRTSNFVMCSEFNRPSVFPTSIIELARLTKSSIIPVFVNNVGKKLKISFGSSVCFEKYSADIDNEEIGNEILNQAAMRIKIDPSNYSNWLGLHQRNVMALEVIETIREQDNDATYGSDFGIAPATGS